jgi:hypothetical protein
MAVSRVEPVFRKKWHFFRGAKCGEKWRFVVGEKWRKMALFFAERNAAKNGALLLAKNGENGAFQKKFERKKLAKNDTFETKNRLSPAGLGTTTKYLRRPTSAAAGNGLGTTIIFTCDAQ